VKWCKVRVEQITRRVSHPAPAPQPPMQEPAAPLMPSVQDQEELRTQLAAKTTEKQQADETLATGVAELASMQAELASMQDLVKEKQRSVREQRRTAKDKAREEQKLSDLVSAGDAAREAKSRQLKDVAEAARASAAAAQTAAEAAEREFAMFATGNSSSQ
jgi:DNA repair photolyase